MSNLIPTPRADKNGKVVTRHIKNRTVSTSTVNIPVLNAVMQPARQTWIGEAATPNKKDRSGIFSRWKRKRAIKSLTNVLFPGNAAVIWGASANTVGQAVEANLTTEEILMAQELAQLVNRRGVPQEAADADTRRLIWSLREQADVNRMSTRVQALYAHKDWLEAHPGEAEKLRQTIEKLIELDMVDNDGRNGIDHLDEYMAGINCPAFEEYDIIHIWRKDYLSAVVRHPDQIDNIVSYFKAGNGFKEEGFEDYLRSAGKHPDKIDRMADFIKERGSFDEEGFEEYFKAATPLADGAL